jgi:hypothetical protein
MPNVSPILLKGSILLLDPSVRIPLCIITFQYDPDVLTAGRVA